MHPPRHLRCCASNSPKERSPAPSCGFLPRALQQPPGRLAASRRGGVGLPNQARPTVVPAVERSGIRGSPQITACEPQILEPFGLSGLSQGRCQPRRLQVRDRAERAGPSSSCAGSRSRRYSSRSPSPRAMSRRSLRSAKNRRRGAGWSRTHSVYMNCPMHQHAPNATLPATSVHHTTAKTSHTAFPSCCHASPYGFPYLTSPTSSRGGRTRGSRSPVGSGRRQPTPKYIGGKG